MAPENDMPATRVHDIVIRLRASGDDEAANAIVELQDLLFFETCGSDSYGVPGSDWTVCGLCGAEDKPGVFAKGVPHEETCPCYGSTSQERTDG
jgi:hypothetical protein